MPRFVGPAQWYLLPGVQTLNGHVQLKWLDSYAHTQWPSMAT